MKTKKDTKTTAASANLTKPSKPKRHRKRKWLIIGIFMAVILIGVIVTIIIKAPWSPFGHIGRCNNKPATNAPRDIMACYLNDKYGKDFVLTGKIRRTPFGSSALWEHYYESDAYPVDDPRLRFKVKLDGDNKEHKFEKSDTYIEEGQILAEEDRLRPAVERIFGKNTKFGVESLLCEKGRAGANESTSLSQAINVCKKETAGMTKDQISDSYIRMYHSYELYIYDPDGQSIETNDDKARIVERLKEVAKYLPEGRPDSMWLCYFIKHDENSRWNSELKVSVDDLREMTDGFSNDWLKLVVTNDGGMDPYPIRKGWDK